MKKTPGDDVRLEIRLKYLYADRDRHGNWRYYVRPPGCRKTRLRAEPGSPEFLDAYHAVIDSAKIAAAKAGGAYQPGSFGWLVKQYRKSAEWQQLATSTRYARGKVLDRALANVHDKDVGADGHLPYRLMKPKHCRARRDVMVKAPESANAYVKALRQVFSWGIATDRADSNPAALVPYLRPANPDGFHTWTVAEVAQYTERWPLGTKAYLALALFLFTGVRRSDAAVVGRQMERTVETGDGSETWLQFIENKGRERHRKERSIPMLPALRAAIAACPSGHMTYLVSERGKPFTADSLGNRMRKWCDAAGLAHCSAHGLRKAGATIAANNGASDRQLMAIYGWETAKQATVYTRKADRRKLAGDAMHLISLPATKSE